MFPVLILEDDPGMRLKIRDIVAGLGLDATTCPTPPARQSLELEVDRALEVADPVAAVVDLGLPRRQDGEAIVERILDARPGMPIVLISGDVRRRLLPPRLSGLPLLRKDKELKAQLEVALRGLTLRPAHLAHRVRVYLASIQDAKVMWLRFRNSRGVRQELSQRLEDERRRLDDGHREYLRELHEALQSQGTSERWPPPKETLEKIRKDLYRLVDLLPRREERLSHFVSHELANNFLLGLEYVLGQLESGSTAKRLSRAAREPGADVPPDLVRQLECVSRCLDQPGKSDLERVTALDSCFTGAPSLTSPAPDDVPYWLDGWGAIRQILLVENNEVLFPILRSTLQVLYPGLAVKSRTCVEEACAEIRLAKVPAEMLVLLDLSIPRRAGDREEHPDFGEEVLRAARERGCPVAVVSGVVEMPDCIRRTAELGPVAFIPKSTPHSIRDRLRSLLRPRAGNAPGVRSIRVMRRRRRHVLVDGEVADIGAAGVRLLEVLEDGGGRATMPDLESDSDLYEEFRTKGDRAEDRTPGTQRPPLKDFRKKLADCAASINQAVSEALQRRGRRAERVIVLEGQKEATVVHCTVPLQSVPSDAEEKVDFETGDVDLTVLEPWRETPRALRLLLVEPSDGFAGRIQAWLSGSFPWIDANEVARATTLKQATALVAEQGPFDLVLLELTTRQEDAPSLSSAPPRPTKKLPSAPPRVEAALEWMRSVAAGSPPPEILAMAASDEPLYELLATAGPRGARTYVAKRATDTETRAQVCMAVAEAYQRRFGHPRVSSRRRPRPLEVAVSVRGEVSLDGVAVRFPPVPDPLVNPKGWAAPYVLEMLARHPMMAIHQRVLLEWLGQQDGGPSGDDLPKRFLNDVVAECRRTIVTSFASAGRNVGYEDAILTEGQEAYLLNGIRTDGGY